MSITAQYVSISEELLEGLLSGDQEFSPILDELDATPRGAEIDEIDTTCRRYAKADCLNRKNIAERAGMSEDAILSEIESRGIHLWFDLESNWREMHLLLTGEEFPIQQANSYLKQNSLLSLAVTAEDNVSDEEMGYGPPRYLKAANVQKIYSVLEKLNFEELNSKHNAADADDEEWLKEVFEDFKLFYARAANSKNAIAMVYL